MLAQYLVVLLVLVSLSFSFFPFLQETLFFIAWFFFLSDPLAMFITPVGVFFLGWDFEKKSSAMHLGVLYVLGVVSALLFAPGIPPALVVLDVLIGALVALDPFSLTIFEFIPMPVILAAVVILVLKLILTTSLAIIPLLIGIAYGYFVSATAPKVQPPAVRY